MQITRNDRVLSTVKRIEMATTPDQALDEFMDFAGAFGFDRFLIVQMVNPLGPDVGRAMRYTDWPDEIIRPRFEGMGLLHDPVVQFGLRSRFPFSWDQAYAHASKFGRKMMDETKDYDLIEGYSFPMRRPGAPIGGVSLGAKKCELSELDKAEIELLSLHVYARLERLHPHDVEEKEARLSPQEIDVLQFAAAGKSAWEISVMLGISESGVKKALLRAREKLDAVNTVQACASAIARDLILP